MPIGILLLVTIAIIIYVGAGQRVLDRLYLTDNMALVIIASIIAGSFIEIPVSDEPFISINVGGALIPTLLALYVISRADTNKEFFRTIVASIITAIIIFGVSYFFKNYGEGRDIIDPLYIFPLIGGLTAYIIGRSRRGAFVAGVFGFLLYDLTNLWQVITGKLTTQIRLGDAGAFDSIILSGLFAVLLAELIGESRERIINGKEGNNNE
jgi:uncharacterized membrane protein